MNFLITLGIAILPVYLIGLYVYKMDNEKESKKILTKLFIFGMISCIPAGIIEITVEPLFGQIDTLNLTKLFIYVAIGIALVEEILKWIIVYAIGYKDKEFNQTYDILVYCVFVSLGFACFENVLYVLFDNNSILTGILRAVTAIPGHTSDAIIMANYLGLAKIEENSNNSNNKNKYLFLSIFMPTLIHAIYDYCLFTENFLFIAFFAIFLIIIYIYSIRKIKKLSKDNKYLTNNELNNTNNEVTINNKYCPKCGTKVEGQYCTKCGQKQI